MSTRILFWTVMAFVAGCGGSSQKGAASASSSSPGASSTLSITQVSNDTPEPKFAVSGPAYGFFAPEMGAFNIFVVDASGGGGGGAPDCNHLKELRQTQKGRFVDLWLSGNVSAPGKKAVAGAMYIDATGGGSEAKAGNGRADGVSVDFKTVDAKSFEAEVTTDPSAKGPASGSLHGIICDVSSLTQGSAEAAPPADGQAPVVGQMKEEPTAFALEVHPSPGSTSTTPVQGLSMVKLDPKTKVLAVATWPDQPSFPGDPPFAKPTCDVFTGGLKSLGANGAVTIIYAKNVGAHGAGKYPVYAAQDFMIVPSNPDKISESASADSSIDVQKFDDKDFAAKLVTTAKMNDMKNVIAGSVCPNGHVDVPAAKTDKAAPGKKK